MYETLDYPEDIETIKKFLRRKGVKNIPPRIIQQEYRDFCEDTSAAGWLEPDEYRLEAFYRYFTRRG